MFKRILIANRGEIALRILRTCREMRIETVCVFSEADRGAEYLDMADRTVCIGPPAPTDSYLRSDRIIAAAEMTGAEAIHPGYGFLAENAAFADRCRDSNIQFIGPSAESMRQLGDKATARKIAAKARVPIVPGSEGLTDDDEALETAEKIGYPVMIKATAGGGGRGMRIARSKVELEAALSQARREAHAAFNDSGIYVEKYIDKPRHVEVQIIGDQHGHIVHLFERDCSLQRRHQKLIEETPSPAIDAKTRQYLCAAAVKLAKAAQYSSAGTFEFLVGEKGKFYFIEANTRIQVEHPVTELTTDIDLIRTQIEVAAGHSLPFTQRQIRPKGAAIECRINAEDPAKGFRPCPGTINTLRLPGGPGVRIDTHAYPGYKISPRYDSMIAKLIVYKPDREQAIQCALRCLSEFTVEPIKTTIPFYLKVLDHPAFKSGQIDTGFVERTFPMEAAGGDKLLDLGRMPRDEGPG